jgi:uncharacterized repeat protein (TIGR03803 family)
LAFNVPIQNLILVIFGIFFDVKQLLLLMAGILALCLEVPRVYGAMTFKALAAFNDTTNGANPYAPPVLFTDGNLYGVTPYGGSNGVGVLYKVTTNAQVSALHVFGASDGTYPISRLTPASDGNLYGTTSSGGTNGAGTIFKITTNGVFTVLYSFGAATNALGYYLDGTYSYGGMIQGQDGKFYGVTFEGGVSNVGTVFQFSTNDGLHTLYSFTGDGSNDDGSYPYSAPLVEGAAGVFYGTTSGGGTNNVGTIFQITTNGTLTNLYEFDSTNSRVPYAGLSFGMDGNLYGTTINGGVSNVGTVFQITTNGSFSVLVQFTGPNGEYPDGGVVPGISNNLYGTTYEGGALGYGTVFKLASNGVVTTLYSFTNTSDGSNPYAGVTRDASGNLYGATLHAGAAGYGTIFRLSDTNPPTLSITAPTAGQRWSNSVFTVAGTAADNVSVANVFCSVNNSAWETASTANHWTNWTAQVPLTPGTNTITAYAMDDSGNLSTTGKVLLDFVVTNQLVVQTAGPGTISPNYSNAWLEIGRSYSMTATVTAGKGFAFTNWTGGTGLTLAVLTNGAALTFTMQSNLVLQANFVDTNKPVLAITNPAANTHFTNTSVNIEGTATDNVGVVAVYWRLGSGTWSLAAGTNRWTAMVNPSVGTDVFSAYAVDAAGNLSPTNTLSFIYSGTFAPMAVQASGEGRITPNYDGQSIGIGQTFTMMAVGTNGFAFTSWTGGTSLPLVLVTNGPAVIFVMQSNLVLQANFADVQSPTIAITNPLPGGPLANLTATVGGTAADNDQVVAVMYQLNGGAWAAATGTNQWSATVTLSAGTNVFSAYSVDEAGNDSATNSIGSFVTLLQPVISGVTVSNNVVTVSFPSVGGANYSLEYQDVLGTGGWTALGGSAAGTGGEMSLSDSNPPPGGRFYRLEAQ